MQLTLNLLVLHCKDINATRRFYEHLGFKFTSEKHGKGPEHYASENAGFVLELYPAKDEQQIDQVRLGFSIPLLADVSGDVRHNPEITILKSPYTAGDRLLMLLQDPDGRKVEISQQLHF